MSGSYWEVPEYENSRIWTVQIFGQKKKEIFVDDETEIASRVGIFRGQVFTEVT